MATDLQQIGSARCINHHVTGPAAHDRMAGAHGRFCYWRKLTPPPLNLCYRPIDTSLRFGIGGDMYFAESFFLYVHFRPPDISPLTSVRFSVPPAPSIA